MANPRIRAQSVTPEPNRQPSGIGLYNIDYIVGLQKLEKQEIRKGQ